MLFLCLFGLCLNLGSALCPVVYRVVTLWNFQHTCCFVCLWAWLCCEVRVVDLLPELIKGQFLFFVTSVLKCSWQWFSAPREWKFSLGEARTHLSPCRPSFIYRSICIFFICMHTIQTSANVPRFNEIWWSTFLTLQYYSTFIGKWAKPVIHAV